MRRHRIIRRRAGSGFSLLETMIVMAILLVITAAIFQQIGDAQARSSVEQSRLDLFQESREFMDQMTRDLRDAGYPNYRNFADAQLSSNYNDAQVAVGLVKVDRNELWFESSLPKSDGLGGLEVHSIHYYLDPDGPSCPCLRRGEVVKATGDPVGQVADVQVEVQNVRNAAAGLPIFRYFDETGSEVTTLPENITANSATMATISTVQVTLVVQSPFADLKTGQKPVITLVSAMRLHNCSPGEGGTMSCSAEN